MPKKAPVARYSANQLAGTDSETDWARADAVTQDDIERGADAEEGPLPTGWEQTIFVGLPEPKKDVRIRLDPMVLHWFKSHGPGYQTRINAVLRAFVQARLQSEQER